MEIDTEPMSKVKSSTERDIVRMIGQHLINLGLKQTVEQLLQESGLNKIEHPSASNFQHHILNGEWDKAETYLSELALFIEDRETCITDMKFLLAEQKYLELVEDGQHSQALQCLRLELTPLKHNFERLHRLSGLIMCTSIADLRQRAKWDGKGLKSRQRLIERFHQFIPPSIMLPPKRLSTLLNQALQLQKEHCPLHNQLLENDLDCTDLLTDHTCSKDKFPCETIQILKEHNEEVLYCKFSNDGTKLASGDRAAKLFIWDVNPNTLHLTKRLGPLECGARGNMITCLSWSPDDSHLIACASGDYNEGPWIWNIQNGVDRVVTNFTEIQMTTCSWHREEANFAGGSLYGNLYLCDMDGNVLDSRDGVRSHCLAFRKDSKTILVADTHNRIRAYRADQGQMKAEEMPICEEDHSILSFSCDSDDRLAALSLMGQGIHLWDLNDRMLLRRFQGVTQGIFTIHTSFGGANQTFLASGSEDCKIYIYHIQRERPIAILSGHQRCVNCVSWNSKYHELLVSASDDGTIRVWAPSIYKS